MNKSMMKRSVMVLLLTLVALNITWAAGESEPEDVSLKLTGWSYEVDTVNENLDYFSEQTGIKTEDYFNFPSNEYHDKQVTSFIGGTEFDVIYTRDSYLAEWASAGWIEPINDFNGFDEIMKDIPKGAIELMSYQGKVYGLPYYAGRRVMAYNMKQIKEAGFSAPPETWEELVNQAEVIKEKGISEYPIILELNKSAHIMEALEVLTYGRGGRLFDNNNVPVFATSDNTLGEAVTWIKDNIGTLIDPASLNTTDHEVVRAMGAGTRTFAFLSDYNLKTLNDPESSKVVGEVKMALIPGNDRVKSGSLAYIRFYAISSDCPNKEEAFELLKFLGWKDSNGDFYVAKKWAVNFGLGFVQKPLYDDPDIIKSINEWGDTEVLKEQDEYVVSRAYRFEPWFQEWQTIVWGEAQKAIMGEITVDEFLKNSEEKALELIEINK